MLPFRLCKRSGVLIAMSMTTIRNHQSGLTLIELMVAITLGIFVLSGLVYIVSSSIRTNTETLRATQLNQELRGTLHLIIRDLRRAGGLYDASDAITFSTTHGLTLSATSGNGITITADPSAEFDDWVNTGVVIKTASADIVTGDITYSCITITGRNSNTELAGNNTACLGDASANAFPSTTIGSTNWIFENAFSTSAILTDAANATDTDYTCIIFGYDKNKDNVADSNENYGYRYDNAALAVETWQSGTIACDDGTWANVTDENTVEITNFLITLMTPIGASILEYQVSISGRLKAHPEYSRTVEDVVRVRNDPVL